MQKQPNKNTPTSATTGGIAETKEGRPTIGGKVPQGYEQRFNVAALRECELLRPPRPRERCPLTNLSRTGFIETAEAAGALIRLRKRGAVRGTLLADREKLLGYLRGFAGEGVAP